MTVHTLSQDTQTELPYSCQWIDEEDIASVVEVLKSSWLTQGPESNNFKSDFVAKTKQVHYIPITQQPYYKAKGLVSREFPQTDQYYKQALSIPLFPKMTDSDYDRVIKEITELT